MIWLMLCFFVFLCGLFSAIKKSNILNILCVLCVFILSFFTFINGVDWVNYYDSFDVGSFSFLELKYEIGFSYLFGLMNIISDNFFIAIMMYYLFCCVILLCFIKNKIHINYNIPILLFAMLLFMGVDLFIDQLRQLAAVLISLFILFDYAENNKKNYILLVFASLFHISALIVAVFFIIDGRKGRALYISFLLFIVGVSTLIALPYLIKFLTAIINIAALSKLSFYLDRFEVTPRFGFLILVDIAVIILSVFSKNRDMGDAERRYHNLIILSTFMHLSFYFFPIMQRMMGYFYIPHVLLISLCFNRIVLNKINRYSFCMCSIISIIGFSVFMSSLTGEFRPSIFNWSFLSINEILDVNKQYVMKMYKCMDANSISLGFCSVR